MWASKWPMLGVVSMPLPTGDMVKPKLRISISLSHVADDIAAMMDQLGIERVGPIRVDKGELESF